MISSSPKVLAKDALALLSLRSAPTSPSRLQSSKQELPLLDGAEWSHAVAKFEGKNFEYLMRQKTVLVGRSSSRARVSVTHVSRLYSNCRVELIF